MDEDCSEMLDNVSMSWEGHYTTQNRCRRRRHHAKGQETAVEKKGCIFFLFEIDVHRGLMANFLVTYRPWRTHLSLSPLG